MGTDFRTHESIKGTGVNKNSPCLVREASEGHCCCCGGQVKVTDEFLKRMAGA